MGTSSPTVEDLQRYVGHAGEVSSKSMAPVVRSVPVPEGWDVCEGYARLRRGEDSFCFQHHHTTVMGTEPSAVIRTRSPEQTATDGPFLADTVEGNVVGACESVLASVHVPEQLRHPSISELNGVLFGFIGFDAIRTFEPHVRRAASPPKDVLQMPEAVMFVCTSLIVVQDGQMHIMAMCPLAGDLSSNYALALRRIDELQQRLLDRTQPAPTFRDYDGPPSNGLGESNWGADGYKSHVRFLKDRIVAGDMVQTVPSHRLCVETPAHPFNVWRTMRRVSPSLYSYYVECKHGLVIVGASPELLVSVQGGKFCETHPIAGTRKRGVDAAHDESLKANLLADEKERAEHVMLVDLGRNDLNRVCSNVSVPRLMQVDFFSHVMHIVSRVTGELRPGLSGLDAFRSVFPAGTVSGAPKLQAVEHIYTREKERRGLYAGALGFLDLSGKDTHTCIAIRTLMWLGPKRCYAQAGGGIVLDSNEEDEYQETVAKMNGVLTSVRVCEQDGLQQTGAFQVSAAPSPLSQEHAQLFHFNCSAPEPTPPVPLTARFEKGCVLLVDNYDSFTWNLYQFLSRRHSVVVVRNDEVTVEECLALEPSHVVIGPGPCSPAESGICANVIRAFAGKVPILGVCMGMEVMTTVYGGKIDVLSEIKHGKTSAIVHDGRGLYTNVTQGIHVVRYHSLGAFEDDLEKNAPDLEITSRTEGNGIIMGLRHRRFKMEGVQFHPESIKTDLGHLIFENFLSWTGGSWDDGTPPTSILQTIMNHRRADVDSSAALPSLSGVAPTVSLRDAIEAAHPRVGIVAEVKRASPSKGNIAGEGTPADVLAQRYAAIPGVVGVSVLTEPRYFKGALHDIALVRSAVGSKMPILRKDFIFSEYQVLEARAHGADSVLLIVAVLTENELRRLLDVSRSLGMEPLVEAANEYELERAIRVGATLVGINARDLHTFQVSVERACQLIQMVSPEHRRKVLMMGLSGVSSRREMSMYEKAGASGTIIGEHLMKCASVPREVSRLFGYQESALVKICGLCSLEDARCAADAGAQFLGLIFAPQSKRVLTVEQARPIVDGIRQSHPKALLVGVFAEQTRQEVEMIQNALKLDVLQFSKGEAVILNGPEIWQAVHVEPETVPSLAGIPDHVLPLFDTASPAGGGSGKVFDWATCLVNVERPFVLAGGLTPLNVQQAIRSAPGVWAVDVCSGVEDAPRVKNHAAVRAFVHAAVTVPVRKTRDVTMALVKGEPVSADEIGDALVAIVSGSVGEGLIGAFLTALSMRHDIQHRSSTLLVARERMLEYAEAFNFNRPSRVLDIVGTGGDGHDTFNVSTAAALLVGSMHLKDLVVAKHGNRSSSGKCGSADFVEALGEQEMTAQGALDSIQAHGVGFLFAPAFHPAMAAVKTVRKQIGFRTIFNLLGVLLNPARPTHMVLGVASRALGPIYVKTLARIGVKGLVVCAENGLDEISPCGGTYVWRIDAASTEHPVLVHPVADFGLKQEHSLESVGGGSPSENASRWRQVQKDEAIADWVAMNAGAALVAIGECSSFAEGTAMAKAALFRGSGRIS